MSLTLYCTNIRKEEKNLMREAERQHLKMKYVLVKNGVDFMRYPSLAVIRTLGHSESVAVSSMLELAGSKTINSSVAIRYCVDKALAAFLMQSHGVPQPKFDIVFSPKNLQRLSQQFEYPFVIKPLSSSWGRGICLVRDYYCMENWLAGRESIDAGNRYFPVMVQGYIEKPGYDIRVVVVGTKPVVTFKRISENWITNTHLGARVEPIDIDDGMRSIGVQIIEAIGPGFYGIDLFATMDGDYLFNEINHNPDFADSSKVHNVDISRHYIDYVRSEYEKIR